MSQLARANNAKIRSLVLVMSAIFLTLQVISLAGTVVFYLLASSTQYRDLVAKNILTALYPRHQWKWLRREQVLEYHILIASGLEVVLIIPVILLIIGASRKIRCLLLPYLVIFGLAQIAILCGVLACVIYLKVDFKPIAAAVAAFEAFIIFPWWFGVIHLFAIYDQHHFRGSYLVYPPSSINHPLNYINTGPTSVSNSHTRSMLI